MAHEGREFPRTRIQTGPSDSNFVWATDSGQDMASAAQLLGVTCQVQEDCDLTGGVIYCETITGTSPYWKLKLYPVNGAAAGGGPDTSGSALAESAAFQCVADTRHEIAFASSYTAVQGLAVWCGMVHESGTIDGSNYATVRFRSGRADDQQFPKIAYSANSGSSWSISYSGYVPSFTITTDKAYDIGGCYTEERQFSDESEITGADGDRVANKFVMPGSSNPIVWYITGFRLSGQGIMSGDEVNIGVWNTAGVALATGAIDPEWFAGTMDAYDSYADFTLNDAAALESGETYYIGMERPSGGVAFQVQMLVLDKHGGTANGGSENANGFRSWPMGQNGGRFAVWDTTDGTPAWKDYPPYNCTRLIIDPIIGDMHGAGGGGSTISGPSIGVIG